MKYSKYIFIILGHIFLLSCASEKNKTNSDGFSNNGIYGAFYNDKYKKIFAGNGIGDLMVFDNKMNIIQKESLAIGPVSTCISSPNDEYMANTSANGVLYVWKVSDSGLTPAFSKGLHNGYSMTCMFSPDMKYIFSTGSDSTLVLLDWDERKVIKSIKSANGVIHFAWFTADSKNVIWGDSNGWLHTTGLHDWSTESLQLDQSAINCMVSNNQSTEVIAVTDFGNLYLVDFYTFELIQKIELGSSRVFVVEYLDLEENEIITADELGQFNIFKRTQKGFVKKDVIQAHEGICCTIIYNKNKTKLISGGQDGWIKEWNTDNFEVLKEVNTLPL